MRAVNRISSRLAGWSKSSASTVHFLSSRPMKPRLKHVPSVLYASFPLLFFFFTFFLRRSMDILLRAWPKRRKWNRNSFFLVQIITSSLLWIFHTFLYIVRILSVSPSLMHRSVRTVLNRTQDHQNCRVRGRRCTRLAIVNVLRVLWSRLNYL